MILSILLTVATPYLLNTLTNDMTLLQSWRDSFICVTWCMTVYLLGPLKGDMTHSCVRHDSFIYVTWLIHMCGVTHPYMWHSPWLSTCWEHSRVTKKKKVHVHVMIRSHVWHDSWLRTCWDRWREMYSVICCVWPSSICVWRDSLTCVTWLKSDIQWLIQLSVVSSPPVSVWHDSCICVT